jgi:hypothetical protein
VPGFFAEGNDRNSEITSYRNVTLPHTARSQ